MYKANANTNYFMRSIPKSNDHNFTNLPVKNLSPLLARYV